MFFLISIASPLFSLAQEVNRVLILPFEVFAPQDLSYLRKAIPEMLTTRLFTPGKIQVIEQERVEKELGKYPKLEKSAIEQIGKNLGADYVIWGTITQVGDVVSIDANIMDLKERKKQAQFFQEVRSLSDIIPQLTRFSRKARKYIEGNEEDFYREDLALYPAPQALLPGRVHPERGFIPYGVPYYPRPVREEPVVERAKPRFGDHGDPAYEGLTKDLVIDLSGPQPRVGFARSERGNTTQSQPPQPQPLYYYYPPQPNYNYSPPPYYYYQQQKDEGIFSRIKRALWPFGRKDEPVRSLPQPIPVPQQQMQLPEQPRQVQYVHPQPSTQQKTNQPVTQIQVPPSTPTSPQQQPKGNNPWRWE